MTIEQQIRAIFGIPDDKMVTPIGVTMEFESMIARLDIKKRELQKLYDKYMAQVESEDSAEAGRTITLFTSINELGFSEKCVKAFEKKNIYKLGDLKNVTRASLVEDKGIGADNAARIDRIIAPLDVYYKKTEDYQEVGDDVIDDSMLEETDNSIDKELKNSDKSVKNDITAKLKAEIKEELTEELTAELRDTICQSCEYRLATCENEAEDIPTSDINEEELTSGTSGEPVSEAVNSDENAVETVENGEIPPVEEVQTEGKTEEPVKKTRKRRTKKNKTAENPAESGEIPFELNGDLDVKPYEEEKAVDEKAEALEEWEKAVPLREEKAEPDTQGANEKPAETPKESDPYDTKFEMADADDDEFDLSSEEKDDDTLDEVSGPAEKSSIDIDAILDEESVETSEPTESENKVEEPIEVEKPVEKTVKNLQPLPFKMDSESILDGFDDDEDESESNETTEADMERYDKSREDALYKRFEDIIDYEQEKEAKKTAEKAAKKAEKSKPVVEDEETGVVEEVDIDDFDDFPDDLF